jgi:para-aminobenzoate synthetase component I
MTARSTFPLVRAVECFDPLELLPPLSRLRHPFLLHSSLSDDAERWSFFGAEPFETYSGHHYEVALHRWRELSARVHAEEREVTIVPFTGGAVGWWSYDFGRRLERWPSHAADDLLLPDYALGLYDVVGAFDHRSRQAWLFSSGLPYEGPRRLEHATERLNEFESWLWERSAIEPLKLRDSAQPLAKSTFTREQYLEAVSRVQDHIARGDIYQANLSQRWTLPLAGPAGVLQSAPLDDSQLTHAAQALHAAVDVCSPAPFAAFVGGPGYAIVSASPERFLEVRARHVETRPIKGTRPRGDDVETDLKLGRELVASEKDRAENVMIVDVLRNDLGRVCEIGSVKTLKLCELETFPQVFHLTSTVAGYLRDGADAFDLLHACFPGGSITGAPKLRAIEIIEGLEPVRRHVYTGSIGYVDWRGDADWNIAIRTALVTPNAIHFAAGGGVTSDSDPAAEYDETLHKAAGMRTSLARALGLSEPQMRVAV